MVEAAREACGAHEDVILVSHQFPIAMARIGLERRMAWSARRVPWMYLRRRCALGSITTVDLRDPRPETTTYWAP